jgi:hypothetical protein
MSIEQKKTSKASSADKGSAVKEKYRQSETVSIRRSAIRFAPYNPKKHSKEQVAAIRKNIKRVAFLGGIVYNSATGNLVDGHKRIEALDIIHGYDGTPEKDYEVKVEQIALDEKTEREQNIFQTKSRTDLDSELLAGIVQEIAPDNAGLTVEDIRLIELEVPDFEYGANREAEEDFGGMKSKKAEEEETPEERHRRIAKIKEAKQSAKDKTEGGRFLTLTFASFQAKADFLELLGFDQYAEYLPGEQVDQKFQDIMGE